MKSCDYLSIRVVNADPISNVNFMVSHAGFQMAAHTHAFYHINRIMEGSVTVGIDGGTYDVEAGCTMVLPPNRTHSLYSKEGYKQIGIDVECVDDSRGICSEINTLCGGFLVKRIPMTAYTANDSMERMRTILNNPTKGNIMRALNIAESQILDLLELLRNESGDHFFEQFTAMMSEYTPWRLSLSDMCRILGVSRTQLERRSKNAFGCGASEYCARLRCSMICNMLKSDMTLESIAKEMGFYDSCHLSRFFVARVGITPGQYRKIIG